MNEETKVTQIVEQMKNGYEKGFADFYSQTYKYVYSRAKCMFSDEQEAADLTQEVYLAAYRNINSLKENESIFGWLRTITFYQGTKMLKKKRKELLLSEESEELFETIADEEEVENEYMEKQDIEIIRACINRLSEEQKAAILAYYYDNLKVDEIAKLMELSEGTVKSRLYLARKKLKGFIEEEEKKQGYKLHSFGPAALAFVLRSMLQENMELAGVREAGIFASVCQELNLTLGAGAKKGILGAIAGLGAKKIAISAAAVIGAIVIGGASIVALTKKDDKLEKAVTEKTEEIQAEETVEEDVVEVQQWQKDYARILMELMYAPTYAGRAMNEKNAYMRDDILGEQLWYSITIRDRVVFELLDVDGDEIPELFVYEKIGKQYNSHRLMFTTGETIEESYVGLVSDVNTTKHTIALRGYNGGGSGATTVCEFDGNQAIPKLGFGGEYDYEKNIYTRWPESNYDAVEEITKEEYDQLAAEYHCEKDFSTGLYELTLENVEAQLDVDIHISNKFISFYQYIEEVCQEASADLVCKKIYFNNDNQPDYVLSYGDYAHVLVVSGENEYYRYDDLIWGTHSSYYQYIEKAGILIRRGSDNPGEWFEINEINDRYELIHTGTFYERYLKEGDGDYGDPIMNPETGEYYITYEYTDADGSLQEMTEEEWRQRIGALGETIDLGGSIPIEEFFSQIDIDIDIQVAGGKSQGKNNKTLEKATRFTTASASSTLPDEGKYNYSPTNVLTKDASCWVEGASGYGEGEWIKLELPKKQLLSGLEIINGYAAGTLKQYTRNSKITEVTIEFSNGESITTTLEVLDDANKNTLQTIEFDKPVETSYVKLTIKGVKAGECEDTCLTYVAPF